MKTFKTIQEAARYAAKIAKEKRTHTDQNTKKASILKILISKIF